MGAGRDQDHNPVHISRTTEVWHGKNDPKERRRIQNRINQRAFRSRKRAGTSPKSPTPESSSELPENRPPGARQEVQGSSRHVAEPFASISSSWDELGQLINRNLMAAAAENATLLGIQPSVLNKGVLIRLQSLTSTFPPSLDPVRLQYEVAHDPIFDTIPHSRLRYNIMQAIAMGTLDQSSLGRSIRQSGLLLRSQDNWSRDGIVLWGTASDIANWELSDVFFKKWSWLLDGCDDLVIATNVWRSKRGARPFPLRSPVTTGR